MVDWPGERVYVPPDWQLRGEALVKSFGTRNIFGRLSAQVVYYRCRYAARGLIFNGTYMAADMALIKATGRGGE